MTYKLRSSADSGHWLSILLPLCLLPLAVKSHSAWDKFSFVIVFWLYVSQLVKEVIYPSKNSTYEVLFAFYGILSLPASFVVAWFIPFDISSLYLICLASVLSYNYLISKLLANCHGSFTLGEVSVVAQGIILFLFHSFVSFNEQSIYYANGLEYFEAMNLLKLLLLGLFLFVCCLHFVHFLRKCVPFHFTCSIIVIVMLLIWSFSHEKNVFLWLLEFCTKNHRVYLLLFWLISTVSSVAFVVWINKKPGYIASTLDRKYFHIIINAIYIPGIIYDVQFLCFASGIALGAFVVSEIYRILAIPVIGPAIEQAFKIFLDEKDSGVLILTHIYLLIGCSCPLWLYIHFAAKNEYHICLLSGIISVGFGDTFAAIGGTFFGKNFWKGSKKTLEGTAFAIIAQLVSSLFFMHIGHHFSLFNISLVIASIFFTSLLEAKTNQVDNLVLPLFTLSFLSWID